MSNRRLKIILPIAILFAGIAGMAIMVRLRAPVETRSPEEFAPLVRVVTAEPQQRQFVVRTQGTVRPRTETALVSEVSGRIVSVSPSFAAGGYFEEGDALVRVDARDYELALVSAKGQVARAKVLAETEEAQAEVAREEWKELGKGEESPLATRELQLQEALANLASAEAALEQAQRNLDRTRIRAPFAGRIRAKKVDVGQYVAPGTPVADIYAIDYVELRLPIPDSELAFVDLPFYYRGEAVEEKRGPEVRFYSDFAGRTHTWTGRVVRVEGEIDPQSRMVHVIAQVDDPYGRVDDEDPMPLAVGLFVEAEILGRVVDDVVIVPRTAVRVGGRVLIVDDDSRLRSRAVDVLRLTRSEAIIAGGINAGERVCVSTLDVIADGMKVRVAGATSPAELESDGPGDKDAKGSR